MTLTIPTTSELLATWRGLSLPQQNALMFAEKAHRLNHADGFFARKGGTSPDDARSLCPDYLTETKPDHFAITELGINVYRAMMAQPHRPNKPAGEIVYHGTRSKAVKNKFDERLAQRATRAGLPDESPAATFGGKKSEVVRITVSSLIGPLQLQIAVFQARLATLSMPSQVIVLRGSQSFPVSHYRKAA
jgi:hypothetical protein